MRFSANAIYFTYRKGVGVRKLYHCILLIYVYNKLKTKGSISAIKSKETKNNIHDKAYIAQLMIIC